MNDIVNLIATHCLANIPMLVRVCKEFHVALSHYEYGCNIQLNTKIVFDERSYPDYSETVSIKLFLGVTAPGVWGNIHVYTITRDRHVKVTDNRGKVLTYKRARVLIAAIIARVDNFPANNREANIEDDYAPSCNPPFHEAMTTLKRYVW